MILPPRNAKAGPLLQYLNSLLVGGDPDLTRRAKEATTAVRNVLSTPDGRILMELLEKSTTEYFLPPDADPGALGALNAQRFIALDLRRIMSDETDQLFDKATNVGTAGRTGRRRRT